MTNVACFCGYLYSFAGDEGPCPQCGAVAVIKAKATGKTNEQNEPDAVGAGASFTARTPVPSGR